MPGQEKDTTLDAEEHGAEEIKMKMHCRESSSLGGQGFPKVHGFGFKV